MLFPALCCQEHVLTRLPLQHQLHACEDGGFDDAFSIAADLCITPFFLQCFLGQAPDLVAEGGHGFAFLIGTASNHLTTGTFSASLSRWRSRSRVLRMSV